MTTKIIATETDDHSAVKTATLWSPQVGTVNVATYAPGVPVQAFPGCPQFPVWVNVYWYPGLVERITVHLSKKEATAEYTGHRVEIELLRKKYRA